MNENSEISQGDIDPYEAERSFGGGYIANQEKLEAKCKISINPLAFEEVPFGSRILAVQEEVPEKVGGIVVPVSTRDQTKHSMGRAWVLSVGPYVGHGMDYARYPGAMRLNHPAELLYQRIQIAGHVGICMAFSVTDDAMNAQILCLNDLDVLTMCTNQNPATPEDEIASFFERRYGKDYQEDGSRIIE